MKRTGNLVAMTLLCLALSLSDIAMAETKTIYINSVEATAEQIKNIENAFGVTLVPNSHFVLDYLSGNFYQADDNAYIGNVYEYSFSKALEELEKQQANANDSNFIVSKTSFNLQTGVAY